MKTADALVETGVISSEAVCRVINAIEVAQNTIGFDDEKIVAVTTEAVRQASNQKEVLEEIEDVTGVVFTVIDGDEEARLTLLAVKERLKTLPHAMDNFVLVDIGGASIEVVFNYGKKRVSKSFPIGIVTLAQSYEGLDAMEEALPLKMLEIEKFVKQMYATRGVSQSFVATAGTPTTVASMKLGLTYETYDAKRINGITLEKEELRFYLDKLLTMPFEEREMTVGTGRSDLIACGILIYQELYSILNFQSCIVVDDGLREGVALDYCNSMH
ncbi:Exopolyphosphatase [hydrothermal vent metagenome]|uniref:Exopolyphosphatase n=1 Tax=hydrothermal vent metagenome TaxID=652676 RepID=A0A1W1C4C5_9ZZZZ